MQLTLDVALAPATPSPPNLFSPASGDRLPRPPVPPPLASTSSDRLPRQPSSSDLPPPPAASSSFSVCCRQIEVTVPRSAASVPDRRRLPCLAGIRPRKASSSLPRSKSPCPDTHTPLPISKSPCPGLPPVLFDTLLRCCPASLPISASVLPCQNLLRFEVKQSILVLVHNLLGSHGHAYVGYLLDCRL
ncbi:hypothetical protein ACLOJK_030201 [Asimina triloba]